MNVALDDLKPIVDLLLTNGVPLLANMLLPGVGGTVAAAVMPSLVQAFGLTPEASVSDLATAIQADPNAAAKLAVLQERHASQLDFSKSAVDANEEAIKLEPSFWGRLFVGGWRPAMGWVGVWAVIYQIVASATKLPLMPIEMFGTVLGLWTGLAGIRAVEAVKGVARSSLSVVHENAIAAAFAKKVK